MCRGCCLFHFLLLLREPWNLVMKDYYKDTVKLWTTTPPYSGYRSEVISWRLYPAIEHSRIKVYYREGKCIGFVTWAWLTDKELSTREYLGRDVFKRDIGEHLYIIDLIAPHGLSDLLKITRNLEEYLCDLYPNCKSLAFHRKDRLKNWSRRTAC
jgi:hemolysin-activating ACP:hemolysin acyltransferase